MVQGKPGKRVQGDQRGSNLGTRTRSSCSCRGGGAKEDLDGQAPGKVGRKKGKGRRFGKKSEEVSTADLSGGETNNKKKKKKNQRNHPKKKQQTPKREPKNPDPPGWTSVTL